MLERINPAREFTKHLVLFCWTFLTHREGLPHLWFPYPPTHSCFFLLFYFLRHFFATFITYVSAGRDRDVSQRLFILKQNGNFSYSDTTYGEREIEEGACAGVCLNNYNAPLVLNTSPFYFILWREPRELEKFIFLIYCARVVYVCDYMCAYVCSNKERYS